MRIDTHFGMRICAVHSLAREIKDENPNEEEEVEKTGI
jgi:hypothetical protein